MGLFDRFTTPMRRQKFARRVAAGLRKAGEPLELRYDPAQFRLVSEGDESLQVNLANTYREYLAAPSAERKRILSRFIRSWIEGRKGIPDEFEDAAYDLLPGVRSRSTVELLKLQMESQGKTGFHWPYRVVADHYGAGLVYDLPHAMSQINGQQLTRWGVDFDEAMDVALDNLRKISEQGFARRAPGVWRSAWHDNYDPSRLLLVDLIAAHEVDGDPVVMVPNRDTLLLTGSEDEVGLGIMAAAAEEATQQPRPIHTMPIRLEFGSWTPFLPPKELPAYLRFKQMLINSLGQDYEEQRALLTTTHQKQSENVFVASYSAMRNTRTGELASYCMWAKGLDGLLPRTDLIYFFDPGRPDGQKVAASASWERVEEIVGDLLEPLDIYPKRHRVRCFPTEEQIEAIKDGGGLP